MSDATLVCSSMHGKGHIWFDPKKTATKVFLTDLGTTRGLLSHIKNLKEGNFRIVIIFKMAAKIAILLRWLMEEHLPYKLFLTSKQNGCQVSNTEYESYIGKPM